MSNSDYKISGQKFSWPPNYQLRVSKRAKRMRLQISSRQGLQIIVPANSDKNSALDFLNSKRNWVEKHLTTTVTTTEKELFPTQIKLTAIDKYWRVIYQPTCDTTKVYLIEQRDEVILYGNVQDVTAIRIVLVQWLKKQSEVFLTAFLKKLSAQCQLSFNAVTIRKQQSRWGSCSRTKNINLNCKLMFLPYEWVKYVLIHELCHTKQFNHSEKFWRLVANFMPNHQEIRQQFKLAHQYIPAWV
jgi:hypothetical protein